jgi:hypothetical protein
MADVAKREPSTPIGAQPEITLRYITTGADPSLDDAGRLPRKMIGDRSMAEGHTIRRESRIGQSCGFTDAKKNK